MAGRKGSGSPNVHTVTNKDGAGWVNKQGGAVVSRHRTKEAAVDRGAAVATQDGVDHYIHNRNGQIGRANSYGNDPNPPRDKNR